MNTRGKNDSEVSEELIDFLHYIEDTSSAVADKSKSEKNKRLHKRVCQVKLSEEVGVRYMQAWEERYYEREEGREEGAYLKVKEMVRKKLEKGQCLEKIAEDLLEEKVVIQQMIEEIQKEEKDK